VITVDTRLKKEDLYVPQHFLYFLPLPQGQGSFLPTFFPSRLMVVPFSGSSLPRLKTNF
jgi:hypothetical protein